MNKGKNVKDTLLYHWVETKLQLIFMPVVAWTNSESKNEQYFWHTNHYMFVF